MNASGPNFSNPRPPIGAEAFERCISDPPGIRMRFEDGLIGSGCELIGRPTRLPWLPVSGSALRNLFQVPLRLIHPVEELSIIMWFAFHDVG